MPVSLRLLSALLLGVSFATAADPALLRLAMPDARLLLGIDVARVKASPLMRFMVSQAKSGSQDFNKLAEATGFDPTRDLDEVLIAATADARQKQNALIMVKGRFDPARITALAVKEGGVATRFQGIDIISGKQRGPQNTDLSFAFLDPATAVAGDPAIVRSAIARRIKGSALHPGLVAKAGEMSGQYEVWMVSRIPASEAAAKVTPPGAAGGLLNPDAMKGIEEFTLGMRFGPTVEFVSEAVARTEKDAQALVDVARFIGGMVKLNQKDPKMAKVGALLDTLQLSASGRTARFSLSIPEADIESFIQEAQAQAKANAARPAPRGAGAPTDPSGGITVQSSETPANAGVVIHSSPKDMGVVTIPPPKKP